MKFTHSFHNTLMENGLRVMFPSEIYVTQRLVFIALQAGGDKSSLRLLNSIQSARQWRKPLDVVPKILI